MAEGGVAGETAVFKRGGAHCGEHGGGHPVAGPVLVRVASARMAGPAPRAAVLEGAVDERDVGVAEIQGGPAAVAPPVPEDKPRRLEGCPVGCAQEAARVLEIDDGAGARSVEEQFHVLS